MQSANPKPGQLAFAIAIVLMAPAVAPLHATAGEENAPDPSDIGAVLTPALLGDNRLNLPPPLPAPLLGSVFGQGVLFEAPTIIEAAGGNPSIPAMLPPGPVANPAGTDDATTCPSDTSDTHFICTAADAEITGPEVVIDKDWVVLTDIEFGAEDQPVTVKFGSTPGRHYAIRVADGIAFTATETTFKHQDEDFDSYSLIDLRGPVTISQSEFSQVIVVASPWKDGAGAWQLGSSSTVTESTFRDSIAGLLTNQNMTVSKSTFTRTYTGLGASTIPAIADNSAEPTVRDSLFAMNEIGIHVGKLAAGTYERNNITANWLGVYCQADGGDLDSPTIKDSNIYGNYGDAFHGQQVVEQSKCELDNNYYGATGGGPTGCTGPEDSRFKSALDTLDAAEAVSCSAHTLPDAPSFHVDHITSSDTWESPADIPSDIPYPLQRPLVVEAGATLTIDGFEDSDGVFKANGHTIGAKKTGSINFNDTIFDGQTSIYMRDDDDSISNVEIRGGVLFSGVVVHRSQGSIEGLTIEGGGAYAVGVRFAAGLASDDGQPNGNWRPTLKGSTISGVRVGVFTNTVHPVVGGEGVGDGNTIEDAGIGIFLAVNKGATITSNDILHTREGVLVLASEAATTATITDNRFDMGYVGLTASANIGATELSGNTFTNLAFGAVIAQSDEPPPAYGSGNVEVRDSLFAFTLLGLGVINPRSSLTLEGLDLQHNYGVGAYHWSTGTPTEDYPSCVDCYKPADEVIDGIEWDANAPTQPRLGSYREPTWWNSSRIITTDTSPDGPLVSPWIAVNGAKILIEDQDLDLGGFAIGAKGAPPGSAEGRIELRRSLLSNGGFVFSGSSSVTLDRVRFDGFENIGLGIYGPAHAGTFTCASFETSPQAGIVVGTPPADELATFQRIRVETPRGIAVGYNTKVGSVTEGPPNQHVDIEERVTVEDSLFMGAQAGVIRYGESTIEVARSNFNGTIGDRDKAFPRLQPAGFAEGWTRNGDDDVPDSNPSLEGNYWGHADGPRVAVWKSVLGSIPTLTFSPAPLEEIVLQEAHGLEIRGWDGQQDGWNAESIWDDAKSSPIDLDPCVDFHVTDMAPLETLEVTFTDETFTLDERSIVSRQWSIDEPAGVDEVTDPGDVTSFPRRFNGSPNGSSYVVNLTITMADPSCPGSACKVTKLIAVQNVAPIVGIDVEATGPDGEGVPEEEWDELTNFTLTGLDLHPNEPFDEVTSWAWKCIDDGTGAVVHTDDEQNTTIQFSNGGEYTCTLTGQDGDLGPYGNELAGSTSKSFSLLQVPPNTPTLEVTPASGREIDTFTLSATATHPHPQNGIDGYKWQCVDTDSDPTPVNIPGSTASTAEYRFSDGGLFECTVIAHTDDVDSAPSAVVVVDVSHVAPDIPTSTPCSATDEATPCTLSGSASHQNDEAIQEWSWECTDTEPDPDVTVYKNVIEEGFEVSTSIKFPDGGTYTCTLTVTDDDDQSNMSSPKDVVVTDLAPTDVHFTYSGTDESMPYTFNGTATHPDSDPLTWDWDCGSGTNTATASGKDTTIDFPDGGTWSCTLTVTDHDGFADTDTDSNINVPHAPPNAPTFTRCITTDEATPCALTGSASHPNNEPIQEWSWECTETEPDPDVTVYKNVIEEGFEVSTSLKFPDGGTYTCTLTVTDDDDQSNTSTPQDIVVSDLAPTNVNFTYSGTDEASPYTFNGTADHPDGDPLTSWEWACESGTNTVNSTGQNTTIDFPDGGTWSCTLTVTDHDGLTANHTKDDINVAHVAPNVPTFTHCTTTDETASCALSGSATHPNDEPALDWSWKCVDSEPEPDVVVYKNVTQSGLGLSTSIKFPDGGTYACTLTVTDDDGLSNTSASQDITVTDLDPVAQFTYTGVTVNDLFNFTDTSTHPNPEDSPDASTWTYSWEFGDGSTSTARNPSHTYVAPGNYDVNLTVTDDDGQSNTTAQGVAVTQPPVVTFTEDWEDTSIDPCLDLVEPWECGGGKSALEDRQVAPHCDDFSPCLFIGANDNPLEPTSPWAAHDISCGRDICEVSFDFYLGSIDGHVGHFLVLRLNDTSDDSGNVILDIGLDDEDARLDVTNGTGVTEVPYDMEGQPGAPVQDITVTVYRGNHPNAGTYNLLIKENATIRVDQDFAWNPDSTGRPAEMKLGSQSTEDEAYGYWDNIFVTEI